MKYYLYISKQKVEMLYPQVPTSFVKKIAGEMEVKLAWFTAKLKTTDEEKSLILKTRAVSEHVLKQDKVGTVNQPDAYIFDTQPLISGVLRNYAASLAFFGNTFGETRFALIGGAHSMIGANIKDGEQVSSINYYTLRFLGDQLDPPPDGVRFGTPNDPKQRDEMAQQLAPNGFLVPDR